MSKFLPCKSVCPVVRDLRLENAELRHDVANRDADIKRLEKALTLLSSNKENAEIRLAKIRQLCFSNIVDSNIVGGP